MKNLIVKTVAAVLIVGALGVVPAMAKPGKSSVVASKHHRHHRHHHHR